MCDSTFTFGQRGSHFFQCPSRKEYTRLPRKLANFITSSQLKQIHHIALGFQDSFLLTWRGINGQDHIESAGLPSELVQFLYARNTQSLSLRDISNIRCVLGPYNSSFFAHDGSAYVWLNLPSDLLVALQLRIKDGNWIDRPRIVTLGAHSNFLLVTEKNAAVWRLSNYQNVSTMVEYSQSLRNGISKIHNVVLNPHRFQNFITQSMDGTLTSGNMPPHEIPAIQAMINPVMQDSKEVGRRPLARAVSDTRENVSRRPSVLEQRAQLRREWSEHTQEFSAQAKGVKLSLSFSLSVGGLARLLG